MCDKKIPMKSLDNLNYGDETYWDILEDPETWNGVAGALTPDHELFPAMPSVLATTSAATQYDRLPCSFEMHMWIRDLREPGLKLLWREYFGQVVVISLEAKTVLLPKVGPGARPMRWTACCNGDHPEEWNCVEERVMGAWNPRIRNYEKVIVFYRWPVPPATMGTCVSTTDITNQEKKAAVMRCHVNLGHPQVREFVRLLKAAGTREDIINYVLREFDCPGCRMEKRPPTRLPAATPRTYDFNIVVGVDILFGHGVNNKFEHPVLNITCWGTLYSTFGLVDMKRRTAELAWTAFTRLWIRTIGAPQYLVYDQGNEFVGARFQEGLEQHGICPVVINRDAPFENGVTERRGGLFKDVYYKTREMVQPQDVSEIETLIFEVSWALQTLVNRSGYSPAQRVLGRQPQVGLETLSDQGEYHLSTTQDRAWARAERMRQAAREALVQLDARERLARAGRGRPRREIERLSFGEGEPVMIWRQGRRGSLGKVGPCFVVLQRDHIVWVTWRATEVSHLTSFPYGQPGEART